MRSVCLFYCAICINCSFISAVEIKRTAVMDGYGFPRVRHDVWLGQARIFCVGYQTLEMPQALHSDALSGGGLGLRWPPERPWTWCNESFLLAFVRSGSNRVINTSEMALRSVRVLERAPRSMIEISYSMPDGGSVYLRMMCDPSWRKWIFMRVGVDDRGGGSLAGIRLRCYPSTTIGTPIRERWCDVDSESYGLASGRVSPSVESTGFAFYNRYEQTDDGAFLVLPPCGISSISVLGTYDIATRIDYPAGTKSACFAIGYFVEESNDLARRYFFSEVSSQVAGQLGRIEWNSMSFASEAGDLCADLEGLLARDVPWPISDGGDGGRHEEIKRDVKKRLPVYFSRLQSAQDDECIADVFDGIRRDRELLMENSLELLRR